MTRELTGRHVLAIVVTAFAVIIAANMTMLFAATGSFPGLVVKNSYVAGQGWDARANAQRELGWSVTADYRDGALWVGLSDADGRLVPGVVPIVTIGRPTTDAEDRSIQVTAAGTQFTAPIVLAPGRWRVDVYVEQPSAFTATAEVLVRGAD